MIHINKIELKKWYTVSEVKELGIFLNIKGEPSEFRVIKMIRQGLFPNTRNVSMGDKNARYLVLGGDIVKAYNKQFKIKKG